MHFSCLENEECPASNTRNVLLGTQGMSCLEHNECPAWNTRNVLPEHKDCLAWNTVNVLRGTHEMSYLEHRECLAWNTGNGLLGTQGMSCLEHRACPAWHIKTRCQKLSGAQFHAQEQNRHGHLFAALMQTRIQNLIDDAR